MVLDALSQLDEFEFLGAQNTWTKYREECMQNERWCFFYYLRNKNSFKKHTKCHKEQNEPFFIILSLYENEMMKK